MLPRTLTDFLRGRIHLCSFYGTASTATLWPHRGEAPNLRLIMSFLLHFPLFSFFIDYLEFLRFFVKIYGRI